LEMDRARKDRGEESVLLANRPKIDEELLARDIIVADLQEQLVEARALIAKRRCEFFDNLTPPPPPTPPPSATAAAALFPHSRRLRDPPALSKKEASMLLMPENLSVAYLD